MDGPFCVFSRQKGRSLSVWFLLQLKGWNDTIVIKKQIIWIVHSSYRMEDAK